jgi:AraC-like DNA-binding protein
MICQVTADAEQRYVERRAGAGLDRLVTSAWVQRIGRDAAPYVHRNIPSGGIEVVAVLGGPVRVNGPLTTATVEVLAPGTTVVGLRFRPGAAAGLLDRVPAAELADLSVDAAHLWGPEGAALAERLHAAAGADRALALLEAAVAGRLRAGTAPDALVAEAVRRVMPWRKGDLAELPRALAISDRQLRRRSLAAVGLAPKTLQRQLRFQGFLAMAQEAIARGRSAREEGLGILAAEAGYADQPHLTRECLRLTGLPPAAFLADTQAHCACGHDHAASFTPLLQARPRA